MIKNNAEYFSHDATMRNDRKILAIRNKFGITGYAIWVMILEELCISENFRLEYDDITIETLSGDFRIEPKLLKEIIDYSFNPFLVCTLVYISSGFT